MDRTARPNGWDKPCQWIDYHPSIWRGKTNRRCGRPTMAAPRHDKGVSKALQIFAALVTTLCRTSTNSLPYFPKLFAVLSSEYGKGPVRPRQRVSLPTAKNRTASPKGTDRLGRSASRPSPKSPLDRRHVPVGRTSKARRLVLETLRAIDSKPSGY